MHQYPDQDHDHDQDLDHDQGPELAVRRLIAATNAHDLDALVACFADDYRNETPVHPARGFVGRDQVRANWQTIFSAVPDLEAEVVAGPAVDGDVVWSEWAMRGTRHDGSDHRMAGVIIFRVRDDRIASARFYLEPVDEGASGVDEAVRAVTRT
ncbi:MAG: nuclear transport factor 2 family protein [Acidimicrobiales bacterium]